jgi:hypothetical protein
MPAEVIFSNDEVKVYELLNSGDLNRINAFLALYERFFPKYAHYTPRMRRRTQLPSQARTGHKVHYWLIEYQDTPIGLFMFRFISHRKCGAGTALALDSSVRGVEVHGKSLTAFLFKKVLNQLKEDALSMGHSEYFGMVAEVEHLGLMKRFEKLGMIELPVKYFEPIFPPETNELAKEEVIDKIRFIPAHFTIMPHANSNDKNYSPQLLKDFLLAFLVDHYNLEENHDKVQEMLASIK